MEKIIKTYLQEANNINIKKIFYQNSKLFY